jgi:hypothetical protein
LGQVALVAAAFSLSVSAFAMGKSALPAPGMGNDVVETTILFPNYGALAGNEVCVTKDGKNFRAIPAERTACVKYEKNYQDSEHPQDVCVQKATVLVQTSRTMHFLKCIKWDVNYQDSTHPAKKCIQWDNVNGVAPASYDVKEYSNDDYRHERGYIERTFPMPVCQ